MRSSALASDSLCSIEPSPPTHELKRELRLRDLVQMQILLVVGVTWIGIAAKQGGIHLVFEPA